MARPRSPNRDKALQLWLAGGKSRKLKDIADELQVSEEQIRKWKNLDQWDKVTLPKANSNVTNHRGGQPGNKNAVGHGGTGPPGNKNAVKTGEFETLFFDTLEPEEQQIIKLIEPDKEQLLLQEIQLLTIRERRMLKRIDAFKDIDFTIVKRKKELGVDGCSNTEEEQGALGQIQAIENALTRVQAQKQRAIDALHRFGYDDARLQIELMKVEFAMLKEDNQDPETEDDGFMAAMNTNAAEIWGDADD